jgi:hypothetical protein
MIRGASNTPLGGQSGYSSLNIDKSTEVGLPPWDHSDVAPIPEAGSHDLDFWAEQVGLEPGEIHEVFNPYQFSFPDTNMEFELNDQGMVSRMNSVGIAMFLDELGLNKDNEWNWEPTWVAALMREYPDSLEKAMWRYIRKFKNNAEFAEARKLTFSNYDTEQEMK